MLDQRGDSAHCVGMTPIEPGFDNLDAAGQATARLSAAPRIVVYGAVAVAVLISWLILVSFAARSARAPGAGTAGGEWLDLWPTLPLPMFLQRLLELCLTPTVAAGTVADRFPALAVMWFLMSVAMMLPSAAPMIRTYCEIADTAGRQRQSVAHPLILVAGYLAVWLASSLILATITTFIQWVGSISSNDLTYPAAAAALAFAGLYQFSRLKEACLKKCRDPFSTLFARWTTKTAGIFRLGLEQGLWCLGCCWALMLVMFAVGLMNVFWMALLGVFALAEKQASGVVISRVAGAILLVWSAALLVLSL